MRSASSYRSSRRRRAKDEGLPWNTFQGMYWGNRARALAAMEAKSLNLTPEQARKALAEFAANPRRYRDGLVSLTEIIKREGK